MALIETRKGREDGGYTRLFGDPLLGRLLSRVQSAVIASGSELERFVIENTNTLDDIDAFLDMDVIPEGVFVAPKKVLRKSKLINYADVEPDFVVFERKGKTHHCYLIELKDGDTFDTKKAAGERASLHRFMVAISPVIQFSTSVHFCCFHRDTRTQIVEGFKRKITDGEAMTGREFCNLLGIDYGAIITKRMEHQQLNFDCFMDTLLGGPAGSRSSYGRNRQLGRRRGRRPLVVHSGHPKRLAGDVPKLLLAPRREHSRKPDEAYERIERLLPGPYLEMFSRRNRPGWHVFGNEPGLFDQGPVMTRRRPSRAGTAS